MSRTTVWGSIPLTARGPGPVFWLDLEDPPTGVPTFDIASNERSSYRRFRHSLLSKGVRVMPGGAWYLSASHSDADVELTLATVRATLGEISSRADATVNLRQRDQRAIT